MHEHKLPQKNNRAFKLGIGINLLFIVIEAGFGLSAASLSLLADAGHNLSDVLGLAAAWAAAILMQKKRNSRKTYGYRKSSILAALFNAVFLLIAIGGITVEAIQRLFAPQPLAETPVMIVAGIGILVNGFTAYLFMKEQRQDLNIRGAFLHMAADTLVSAGVVIAAVIIRATGWFWLDPVISLAIAVIIFSGTWGLLKEALDLSLDAVPKEIQLEEVAAFIMSQPTVSAYHDLHVWSLSTTEIALTVHICRDSLTDYNAFIQLLDQGLAERFNIRHSTIQVELGKIVNESVDYSI